MPETPQNVQFAENLSEISSTAISTPIPSVTKNSEEFELCGRRIIDIGYFIQQLQLLNQHSAFGCTLTDMRVISETRRGLNSGLKFRCLMCNLETVIWTNDLVHNSSVSVNTAAVIGAIGIGAGFANMEEFFNTLNIPSMSKNTYASEHEYVSNAWEKCASNEMKQAVEIEKDLAVQRGDIDNDGVPLLTVIVDGTWSKRSYRSNYSALSGAVSKFSVNLFCLYL